MVVSDVVISPCLASLPELLRGVGGASLPPPPPPPSYPPLTQWPWRVAGAAGEGQKGGAEIKFGRGTKGFKAFSKVFLGFFGLFGVFFGLFG